MTQIASLPVVDVYIAFDPTASGNTILTAPQVALPASGMSNSYWTNCSQMLRSFKTNSGRQHYLDRQEAGTCTVVMDNRFGFFFNGASSTTTPPEPPNGNGSGFVIQPRLPIAITSTWSGTTYPTFWGLTDQITEVITDQQNTDISIQCSDLLKQLSLKYMSSSNFWPTYAQSTSAANWYRMDATRTGVVTAAVGASGTVTYTAFNDFNALDNVTITGLGISSGASLNLQNVVVASATPSQFTVSDSTVGISAGTGSAFRTAIIDQIGSNDGNYIGPVSFPTYGAIIYDTDVCVDVGNGGKTANAYIRLPDFAGTQGGLDFWVLGQGIANAVFTIVQSGGLQIELACDIDGFVEANVLTVGSVNSGVQINDGFWHHIGLVDDPGGNLQLYADKTFSGGGALAGLSGWESVTGQNTVIPASIGAAAPSMYVDEIVVSTTLHEAGLNDEVVSRYCAGTLLQLPTNPSQGPVQSGDRIAEILTLAGFGVITAGVIVLNANMYFINDGSAWFEGATGNGFINVEPWYWNTPVTTSTSGDLIGSITDTDIGSFFQKPDGTFAFHNQLFYGTWTWTGTSGTWAPSYTTPSGDHVWTDDDSSAYPYEAQSCQIVRDDADTWTLVLVTPQAGVQEAYENITAEERYGYATLEKSSTLHPTQNLALSTANFLGYLFQEPLPRVGAVELQSDTEDGGVNTAIVGAALGDPVTFKRTSPGASTTGTYPTTQGNIAADMVIESIALSFDAEKGQMTATFALDPYPIRT